LQQAALRLSGAQRDAIIRHGGAIMRKILIAQQYWTLVDQ